MKLVNLGLLHLCIMVTSGQLIIPFTAHKNESSKVRVRRSTGRFECHKMEYVTQRCIGCQDENIGCTKDKRRMVKRYTEKLKCRPEATLVKLEPSAPYYSLEPSMASVKRCNGYCRHGFHTCLPSETSIVKVPVELRDHRTPGVHKCVEYEVEQHEGCVCDCEIREEHCSDRHRHERCNCKCQNESEKFRCLEESSIYKRTWDENKCECICEAEPCSMGFVWNGKECRCEMVAPNDIENFLDY